MLQSIPVEIDYSQDFGPSNQEAWDAEYKANIRITEWLNNFGARDETAACSSDLSDYALPYDFINELEEMDPVERQFVLDELAERPELWDDEEVMVI